MITMPSRAEFQEELLRENRERCDDEFPIGQRELELIRRDTADAEARRRLKPPNFAGEDR
jgi:hypothetical protein